ncbi:MAG: zinc-ribbon domain containing protein [Candidatus Melainabacteria bacterium]|nr:zinc-ribbon domain containing protein [Candidatus Melainabacteria bacterium]
MTFDKNLVCHECQKLFVFSEGEQQFFEQRGLTNLPKRCANCRLSAKFRRNGENLDNLHKIDCTTCGALTVVPFKPSEERPVYCRACFMKIREEAADKDSFSEIAV